MYDVLIVEDDPMVALINEQYVTRSGQFRVLGKCPDGKKALEFLENRHVDLVILDVFMPHFSGIETLRQLREKQMHVDVIMVTAANDRATLEQTLHLGVVDYLVKPFAYERFQTALDKFITHAEALKDVEVLNQKNIDFIIDNSHKKGDDLHPKGIQAKTLDIIISCLNEAGGESLTGDDIADRVGLSAVTVRRYMNYLVGTGEASGEMDYCTGGRPCMVYRRTDCRAPMDAAAGKTFTKRD